MIRRPDNSSDFPTSVTVYEVGARDGLQNETALPTQTKVDFINLLSQSGLSHIEAGSFVSAKRVPQMADSLNVMRAIERNQTITYSALTPNIQGFEMALSAQANEVAIFGSASEGFSQHNINCSISESLQRFEPVMALALLHNIPVRGYLSCVIDCPYDGATDVNQVMHVAETLIDMGCYQVSFGDTIGTGTPLKVAHLLDTVISRIPSHQIAVHFHNTWGQALPNIYQALSMGINTIDASVAGLGGCPYAPGASGNVATEDVVYLCHQLGIETGINLNTLAEAGWMICQALNISPRSNVSLALKAKYLQ
ncbi:hydroxymethylglutaryl-CoA lyase [Photobacterium sp. DNB23_23_1]|uniref:hydroxymethylglutaryl-CoA lyase n=1 Tax=Photobacterium pectinilyticum TaxID=2906793 RepID=A0ABT1N7G9_9GAMM|nr:hydroxymethylglutaryl-CoA lyase [Photobacterium sp. ZSDE20]MCQ1059636.1 hydroxymethylglutaryl-CoA lyase [Photobacterium sp. ZSDE20]MDD1827608.1 hydroxymethylglutaryl-CoA lyase [Photobacterium sp. ZSDE20]